MISFFFNPTSRCKAMLSGWFRNLIKSFQRNTFIIILTKIFNVLCKYPRLPLKTIKFIHQCSESKRDRYTPAAPGDQSIDRLTFHLNWPSELCCLFN